MVRRCFTTGSALSLTTLGGMLAAACAGPVATAGPGASATGTVPGSVGSPLSCRDLREESAEIAAAKFYIEHNATDEDTGVHGAFDDDGWSALCVFDPNGKQILLVEPQSSLGDLTMAGIFFESREPPNDEFSIEDLKAAFPEGLYKVRGLSFDGTTLAGHATFTHDIPAPVTVSSPEYADDEEGAAGAVVPRDGLVFEWDEVTETIDGDHVEVAGYEVIVTKLIEDDPNGFSRPTFDVHVPATQLSLSVPPEFLEPETVYEFEILVLERSGNQTITAGFFITD
jgi:hypothetical protein